MSFSDPLHIRPTTGEWSPPSPRMVPAAEMERGWPSNENRIGMERGMVVGSSRRKRSGRETCDWGRDLQSHGLLIGCGRVKERDERPADHISTQTRNAKPFEGRYLTPSNRGRGTHHPFIHSAPTTTLVLVNMASTDSTRWLSAIRSPCPLERWQW